MNDYISNLALRGAGLTSSILTAQPRLAPFFEPLRYMPSNEEITRDVASGGDASLPTQETSLSHPEESSPLSKAASTETVHLKENNQPNFQPKTGKENIVSAIAPAQDEQSNLPSMTSHQASYLQRIHVTQIRSIESSVSQTETQTEKHLPVASDSQVVPEQSEPNAELEVEPFIIPRPQLSGFPSESRVTRQSERSIHVHIGTIEVRAVTPPPQQSVKELPNNRPLLSLDEYLKRRNEGKI